MPGRRIRTSSLLRALVILPIMAACSTATPEPVAPSAPPPTPSVSIAIAPAEWATEDSVAVDVHGAMVRGFEGARVVVVDPRPEMEKRGEACAPDPDCADAVSRDMGAAKVVRTKLATLGGTVLVRIGVVDLGSGTRDEERQEVVNGASTERIGATISAIAKEIAAPYRPPPPAPPPPPKQAAWYEQWWVWTLVGAAVVGTGVGVGAAVLTRDEGPDVIVTPP